MMERVWRLGKKYIVGPIGTEDRARPLGGRERPSHDKKTRLSEGPTGPACSGSPVDQAPIPNLFLFSDFHAITRVDIIATINRGTTTEG